MGFDAATMGLFSSGVGAVGSVVQGLGQARAEKTNEKQARLATKLDVKQKEREGRALMAEQQLQFLNSGVTLEGTPLSVIGQTAGFVEEDKQIIKATGRLAEQQARQRRRNALVGGIGGGLMRAGMGAYEYGPRLFDKKQ